jgi:hypothetical protein
MKQLSIDHFPAQLACSLHLSLLGWSGDVLHKLAALDPHSQVTPLI